MSYSQEFQSFFFPVQKKPPDFSHKFSSWMSEYSEGNSLTPPFHETLLVTIFLETSEHLQYLPVFQVHKKNIDFDYSSS